jgi:hypothetical protein
MFIKGNKYYIKYLDDEVFYKSFSMFMVFSNSRHPSLYKLYDNSYILGSFYVLDGIQYKCCDISMYYHFVYDEEDVYNDTISNLLVKDINNIIKIDTYNKKSKIYLKKIIKSNQIVIDNLISKTYTPCSDLIQYQTDIQTHLFTNKYTLLENGSITINPKMNIQIHRFNYYCSLLPKSDNNFYVFRKQRLTFTYNPQYQFNEGTSETYLLPFSTTTSYEFAKSWSSHGLILMIHVPKDVNYMVLYNQSQHEITLSSGTLEYIEKGYYKDQPVIKCNYISN